MAKAMHSKVLDATIAKYEEWIHSGNSEGCNVEEAMAHTDAIIFAARAVQGFADEAMELVEATIKEFKPPEIPTTGEINLDLGKMLDRASVEGAVKRARKDST